MWRVLAALLALGLACGPHPSGPPRASRTGVATSADQLFSLGFVPTLALTLDEASRRSLIDHPRRYTAATLVHGGRSYNLHVKLKGNRTFRHLDDKPSLRVKFDDDFLGLHGLVLNSMIDDPTGLHEILAYRLFRAAGVPAPRAAYARLTIDGVPYGTYLMVEPVGRPLLAAALGAPPPAIFEGEYGCDVFAADAPRIELKKGGDDARAAFTALATAADADPHALFDPARSPLDVPEVLSFLAIATLIGDFDGYWHSHNYYLALGADQRWRIVPWGEDRVMGESLPIYGSQGRLARLCFGDHDCRLAYARRLRGLADQLGQIVPGALVRDDAGLAAALLDDDVKSRYPGGDRAAARTDLRDFLHDRAASLRADLSCLDAAGAELDRDGDGYGCMDCDDQDPAIRPGAVERCDQVDNDCDGLVDDAPSCPCEAVSSGGADFQVCDLPMSWDSARAYCQAKGMSLARLDSDAQGKAVFARAIALRNDRWWLGARQADDGSFTWVDGTGFGYTGWGEGEPKNHRCEQRCLVLDDADHGTWALGDCQLYFPFVCRAP